MARHVPVPAIMTIRHEILLRDIRATLLQSVSKFELELCEFSLNAAELSFNLGTGVTRPDGYFVIGTGNRRLRFFLEVDNGTEGQKVLLKRVEAYRSFLQSGSFAERLGVSAEKYRTCQFRVLFVFSSRPRMEKFLLNLLSLGLRHFVRTITEQDLANDFLAALDLSGDTVARGQSSLRARPAENQEGEWNGGILGAVSPQPMKGLFKKSSG